MTPDDYETWAGQDGPGLIRFAYLLTRNQQTAQDLVQEALTQVYRRRSALTEDKRRNAYARRVIVNQLTSWRRRRSWHEQPADDLIGEVAASTGDDGFEAHSVQRQVLWSVVESLPVTMRAVLVLRYYEDFDDKAIADVVGCAPATVRVHIRKALSKLQSSQHVHDLLGGHR